jgi:cation diffusion facilitator family transporter
MHDTTLEPWRQPRVLLADLRPAAERRAKLVLGITLVTMVAELIAGYFTGSMALLADGWHMGSHAAALGITSFAYAYARRNATSDRFCFGTGKVGALGGFASALVLGMVAVLMAVESIERMLSPVAIEFGEAILVACLGLAINVASALLLGGHVHSHGGHDHGHGDDPAHDHDHDHHLGHVHDHDHGHDHGHRHGHDVARAVVAEHDHGAAAHGHAQTHHDAHRHDHAATAPARVHEDQNLRAAYLHVVADAITSVLAIVALIAGRWLGWVVLDPLTAIVASGMIGWWAFRLLRDTGLVLLDASDDCDLDGEIRRRVEADADNRVVDLRIWRLGGSQHAAIVSLVTHDPRSAEHYKHLLQGVAGLDHVTVEVYRCAADAALPAASIATP